MMANMRDMKNELSPEKPSARQIPIEGRLKGPFFSAVLLAGLLAIWCWFVAYPFFDAPTLLYRDLPRMVQPNLQFMQQAIQEGFWPSFHPRLGMGRPFAADPQTGVWYPPMWVAAWIGGSLGLKLFLGIHLFALGLGFAWLVHTLGGGLPGSLLIGMGAVAAPGHVQLLEWPVLMAGTAWVPWCLLCGLRGRVGFFGVSLSAMVLSGHAYLAVMTPAIGLAAAVLAPQPLRRRFLVVLLLVPAITAPLWIGYLTLSQEVLSHGLISVEHAPVTGFGWRHYPMFVFPRAVEDFLFQHANGQISRFLTWGDFGWSRRCYLGLLPLLLCLRPWWRRRSEAGVRAGFLLISAGIALATLLPLFPAAWFPFFHHVHHPASFIQLVVWGMLVLAGLAWPAVLASAGSERLREIRVFGYALTLFGIMALIHRVLSEMALNDAAHPRWNFLWRANGEIYWLAMALLVVLLLVTLVKNRSRWAATALIVALIGLHGADVHMHSRRALPMTGPRELTDRLVPPAAPASGRLLFSRAVLDLEIREAGSPGGLQANQEWVAQTGLPNGAAREGWHQVDDYNPPFQHPVLRAALKACHAEPDPEKRLARMRALGVGWFLCTASEASTLAVTSVDRRRSPAVPEEIVLARVPWPSGEQPLWRVEDGAPVQFAWRGSNGLGRVHPATSSRTVSFTGLPWRGWRVDCPGFGPIPVSAQAGEIGLSFTLPPGADRFSLSYVQPLFAHSLAMAAIGWVGLLLFLVASRRRSAV